MTEELSTVTILVTQEDKNDCTKITEDCAQRVCICSKHQSQTALKGVTDVHSCFATGGAYTYNASI